MSDGTSLHETLARSQPIPKAPPGYETCNVHDGRQRLLATGEVPCLLGALRMTPGNIFCNSNVIPFSSRRSPAGAATTPRPPAPHGDGRGNTDNRAWLPDNVPNQVTAPSVIEIGAARLYVEEFYTIDQFVTVCGSIARALAAWNAYDAETAS